MATLLNFVVMHLEGRKTHVCQCFADFPSAFNCMQPHRLTKNPALSLEPYVPLFVRLFFVCVDRRELGLMKPCLRPCCVSQAHLSVGSCHLYSSCLR